MPAAAQPRLRAVKSNFALCAITGVPSTRRPNSSARSAKEGASATSEGLMPWMAMLSSSNCSRPAGGRHGHEYVSTISPSRTAAMPN